MILKCEIEAYGLNKLLIQPRNNQPFIQPGKSHNEQLCSKGETDSVISVYDSRLLLKTICCYDIHNSAYKFKTILGGSSDVEDWYIFSKLFMKEKKCENLFFYFYL
jgi:hypothetical protein